jgi:penicillin-binding protein 2
MFGFGEKTGLGINGEQRGLVPTKDWHRKHSPEGFQHGFALSTAVGQGDTRVTPIQLALAYGAQSNGGKLYYPRLVDRIEAAEGEVLFKTPARLRRQIEAPEVLARISVGLGAVVNEPHGTASAVKLDYVHVAGKTGTAQVRGFVSQRTDEYGNIELRHRDHAWFVGFAPMEAPEIVVVVFVEHGNSGSKAAAPVAMKIMDRYFREVKGIDPAKQKAVSGVWRRPGMPQGSGPRPSWEPEPPKPAQADGVPTDAPPTDAAPAQPPPDGPEEGWVE